GTKSLRTADFIELQALGKAIALTNPAAVDASKFCTPLPATPQSSVVLVDEIDKAPRDFTNDILDEIENYRFAIKEQDGYLVEKSPDRQILVLMTSNSEKNLPDPFLRRCVFYHIPFPSPELLREIVKTQLGESTTFTGKWLDELIEKFQTVRRRAVRKPPATAELIAWLRILELQKFMEQSEQRQRQQMLDNLAILVKTKEDLEAVRGVFL
ncbi:MAG: MoxR family ATPase, partial [Bacteroidota bacterium]